MASATVQRDVLPQTLVVAMTMMLLIGTTNKCRASDTVVGSGINESSNIIAYQADLEMEFQMDSEISERLLASIGDYETGHTGDPNRPAFCARKRYIPCHGPPTGSISNYCRDLLSRNCP